MQCLITHIHSCPCCGTNQWVTFVFQFVLWNQSHFYLYFHSVEVSSETILFPLSIQTLPNVQFIPSQPSFLCVVFSFAFILIFSGFLNWRRRGASIFIFLATDLVTAAALLSFCAFLVQVPTVLLEFPRGFRLKWERKFDASRKEKKKPQKYCRVTPP